MSPARARPLFAVVARLLCLGTLLLGGFAVAAEDYKPLFSDAVLEKADPEQRARLEALNERNRQRWLQEQGAGVTGVSGGQDSNSSTSGGGTLYRYRDANGNVRFSDRYRPGAEAVSVEVSKPSAASRAAHEARQKEQAQILEYFDDRNRQREQDARDAAEKAERNRRHTANCQDLFNEIQDNRRGGFVSYDIGPDGERVYLSPQELARRTDEMVVDYEQHCGRLPAIDLKG